MRRRWIIVTVIVATLAVVGIAGFLIVRQQRTEASRCQTIASLNAQLVQPIGAGAPVTVIGDSYAQGYGLKDARKSWVAYLGRTVIVHASSSAGYTQKGMCDSPSIPELAANRTGTVIIEGGLNDIDALSTLKTAAEATYKSVHGRVVVVGPPDAPGFGSKKVAAVDATLKAAARDAGVQYISTFGWKLHYLPGGEHLTLAGHAEFGHRVAQSLGG